MTKQNMWHSKVETKTLLKEKERDILEVTGKVVFIYLVSGEVKVSEKSTEYTLLSNEALKITLQSGGEKLNVDIIATSSVIIVQLY